MTASFEIREARPEEYPAAGEVSVEAYRAFYGHELGDYEADLRDVATRAAAGSVLVAVAGHRVVGTVTYVGDSSSPFARQHRDEASFRMLSVSPDAMRRGVGRALTLACVERARAEGKRALVLHADEAVQAGRALYEGLGFARDPARDHVASDGTRLAGYVLAMDSGLSSPP